MYGLDHNWTIENDKDALPYPINPTTQQQHLQYQEFKIEVRAKVDGW